VTEVVLERSNFRHFTSVPTRWSDADALGHINNVMYIRYLECGRLDYFLKVCGMSLEAGQCQGMVLAKLETGFLRQVHHPADLEVATRISRLGNSSFDIDAVIFNQQDVVISSCSVCVWFDFIENLSMPIPTDIRKMLTEFEQRNLK